MACLYTDFRAILVAFSLPDDDIPAICGLGGT